MNPLRTSAFLLAAALSPSVGASLITYDIRFDAHDLDMADGPSESFSGNGRATFDSNADTLQSLTISSDLFNFSWAGNEPVSYGAPDYWSDPDSDWVIYESGYPGVFAENEQGRVGFDFDLWSAPVGAAPLAYLDGALETEMWLLEGLTADADYYAGATDVRFTQVADEAPNDMPVPIFDEAPNQVPEPSVLALLGLGLFALGVSKRTGRRSSWVVRTGLN